MSTSGTDLSTKPAASCKRAPTSKARSASCAPLTACSSPSPARENSRTMSTAKSPACWPARSGPIALPSEPATPDANAAPGQPAPRPLAGPILPLVASSVGTDQLLGGPGSRPAAVDALAARTLVKGEALAPPAGRADDFVWPRREVGREQAKGESPVAVVSAGGHGCARPTAAEAATASSNFSSRKNRCARCRPSRRCVISSAALVPRPRRPRVRSRRPRPGRAPLRPHVPRPPADVGRSAAVPPPGIFHAIM